MRSLLILVVGFAAIGPARAADDVPEAFAPLTHLVGPWKGTGIPTANRLKGWPEAHRWAWKFDKGAPVAMTLEWDGDKAVSRASLTYDPATRIYRLDGNDSAKSPAAFRGTLGADRRTLALEREGVASDGAREKLTIRVPENQIRYTVWLDRREPGAPQFKRAVEVGLTKEGESFAAGGSAAELPRCIVTGGAATINVTFEGKTYPLCCTGCRDEFHESPAKYVAKSAKMLQAAGTSGSPKSARGSDDGSFDGLVDAPKAKAMPAGIPAGKATKPSAEASAKSAAPPKPAASRATTLLNSGMSLDKSGKVDGALVFYRQVVKDFPDSPQAATAGSRIKALEKK